MSIPATQTERPERTRGARHAAVSSHLKPIQNHATRTTERRGGRHIQEAGAIDLVRKFVEHMMGKTTTTYGATYGGGPQPGTVVDWDAIEAAIASSSSPERALGQAILTAHHNMNRVPLDLTSAGFADVSDTQPEWSVRADEPFFAFSVAEVVPDFGDESRYRTRVARRVARLMRMGTQSDRRDESSLSFAVES